MRRLGDMETKLKTIEKSVFEEYQNNLKKRRELEEKVIEKDPVAKLQIVPLDPMKEIESKLLSQQTSTNFKFFIPEIKELQQTYDFPDSLINVLENRFNIKKE